MVRDFLILHYHRTDRDDTEFWRYCANMDVPDSLKAKMELFAGSGLLYRDADDIFRESSWVQVMVGQGLMPRQYHAMADRLSSDQLQRFLGDVKAIIAKAEASLPAHADFIDAHCRADLQ